MDLTTAITIGMTVMITAVVSGLINPIADYWSRKHLLKRVKHIDKKYINRLRHSNKQKKAQFK
jgi:hypothetical protein